MLVTWSNCWSSLLIVVLIHWCSFCSFQGGKPLLSPCVHWPPWTLLFVFCARGTHRRVLGLAFCWQTEKIISVHEIYNLSIKQEVANWFGDTSQKRLIQGNFHFFPQCMEWPLHHLQNSIWGLPKWKWSLLQIQLFTWFGPNVGGFVLYYLDRP